MGVWSKEHLHESVKYLANSEYKDRNWDIAEFGVYRGQSLNLMERLYAEHGIPFGQSFGFDSFEGLPEELPGIPRFYLFEQGKFADVAFVIPNTGDIVKCWFNELDESHIKKYGMKKFGLVHIDGDLYISARDALKFLFSYGLVDVGTIVCYDEFKSTEPGPDGGEWKAHVEIAQEFNVEFEEFFRNTYTDQIECWQNAFVIKSFDRAKVGLMGYDD